MEELRSNSAAAALLTLRMLHDSKIRRKHVSHEACNEGEIRCHQPQLPVAHINEALPIELLARCFVHITSFTDMAMANLVCKKWNTAVKQSLAYRRSLSFAGCRVDDVSVASLVNQANNLLELDMSAGRWGCQITDVALSAIAKSNCCPNLRSVSLWGVTAITDEGVLRLVERAKSLENLNVGGTFITDISLTAISIHCKSLKVVNVWGCKYVTENGLLQLARGCTKLQAMNVFGVKVTNLFINSLATLNSQLHVIKPSKEITL